jgi:hypothetical protein
MGKDQRMAGTPRHDAVGAAGAQRDGPRPVIAGAGAPGRGGTMGRILIAEDEPGICTSLENGLEAAGIKLCIVLGTMLTIAGAVIFGYTWVTYNPNVNSPGFGQIPPGVAIAGAVFFAGFVFLTIASLGHSLRKR